jgi:prepilin-type N-terminal cleavage/methylation domain-containing protein
MEPDMSKFSLFGKKGFGLIEVMVAAVVLGFMIVGLNLLQKGNREAALRIRTRDAAQIVAQQFLDSLSSIGINSITTTTGPRPFPPKDYKWEGKNEIKSQVTYNISANIANALTSEERSNLTDARKLETNHVMAKKVDLTVSWDFRGSTQSISLSRIIK